MSTKSVADLTRLDWEVLHAIQDCARAGVRPEGREFYGRLPDVNPETARKLKNRLIGHGLVAGLPSPPTRRPTVESEEFRDDEPPPAVAALVASATLKLHQMKERENHVRRNCPGYENEILDIIDLVNAIPPWDANGPRAIVGLWDENFARKTA